MDANSATTKLQKLRELMKQHSVDVYIVPSGDAHNSEYCTEHHERRAYISGFTGSAGTAVITTNAALLWTDGRYFIQAEEELDLNCWTLMKGGLPQTPSLVAWILQNSASGAVVSGDPFTVSVGTNNDLTTSTIKPLEFKILYENLVDTVWNTEPNPAFRQPPLPSKAIVVHPLSVAGVPVNIKLDSLRSRLAGETAVNSVSGVIPAADCILLNATPDVAWLFNLRGADFECNPMFLSFALITATTAELFCHETKLTADAVAHLKEHNVVVRPYDDIVLALQKLGAQSTASSEENRLLKKYRLICDRGICLGLYALLNRPEEVTLRQQTSLVAIAKAQKNAVEIAAAREGHLEDAVALCTFLCWLEDKATDASVLKETEFTVSEKLDGLRMAQPNNCGLSFPTISSIDANAAVIHYRPTKEKSKPMTNGVYLVDSGGQYRGSTTDVTRTVHLGSPTDFQKECWALCLKGHIELARAVFRDGTRGPQLDVLARMHLWSRGLDFLHGTGHGVGAQLSVHEGPCGISSALQGSASETDLKPGMIISNEPGYYLEGSFGIRHESLVLVIPANVSTANPSPSTTSVGESNYYRFETLTVVPFQRKFAELTHFTDEELNWINEYHKTVWELMKSRFVVGSRERQWLELSTAKWTR
eukprot:Lankesteria_metandrocarpae@DN3374_c0_g1_i3.p1